MDYSTAPLRQFLKDMFNDQEFVDFCADYFPEVYDDFATGMTKSQKIGALLDYCRRRMLLENLDVALHNERPTQYANRFPAP